MPPQSGRWAHSPRHCRIVAAVTVRLEMSFATAGDKTAVKLVIVMLMGQFDSANIFGSEIKFLASSVTLIFHGNILYYNIQIILSNAYVNWIPRSEFLKRIL